jgi:hypothetical protein
MSTETPATSLPVPAEDGKAEEGGAFLREMTFFRERLAELRPPTSAAPAPRAFRDDPFARMVQAARERAAVLTEPAGEAAVPRVATHTEQPHLVALTSPRQIPEDFRLQRMRQYRARHPATAAGLGVAPPESPLPAPANNWVPLGPSVLRQGQAGNRPAVSGRIAGLAVAPGGQRLYAGTANGGVWRSDDSGVTWISCMEALTLHPTTRQSDSLAVGAVAIDLADPNRIYVGTGEGNTVFVIGGQIYGNSAFFGIGPIRSDDGGKNWIPEPIASGSPSLQGSAFYELAVDPGDRERVVAATLRGLFRREPNGAGGRQWAQKLPGIYTSVRASRAGDATTFYAARWGGGVFSSSDGNSWTSLPGFPTQNVGRVGLAVPLDNPGVVYALAARADNDHYLGVWRLDGGTGPWRLVSGGPVTLFGPNPNPSDQQYQAGQGGYDLALAVDPTNPNCLYLGGSTAEAQGQWSGSAYRCAVTQSGPAANPTYSMTFSYVGDQVHADVHTLVLTPDNPNELWLGCDGGVFATTEAAGACRFLARNTGLATLTMNHLAIHPTEDAVLFCGTQDNGHARYTGEEAWLHAVWGDGGYGVFHPRNPRRVLTTYIRGSINRAEDGGQGYDSWQKVDVPLVPRTEDSPGENVEFYAPLTGVRNPADDGEANLVAFGSVRPWLSDQFGDNWYSIPTNTLSGDSLDGNIRALRFASARKLYAGTTTGRIYRFDRTDTDWQSTLINPTTTGPGALPFLGVPITCIAIDESDPSGNSIYITLAGSGDFRHLWHCTGTTWEARSGPADQPAAQLLDVQHNAVVVDPANPATLYAGADIGVWRSSDAGTSWQRFSYGLPEAAVLDLALHPQRRLLWAATHGRGVYEYAVDSSTALGVELYLRHTTLDRGRRPTDVGLPDPTDPTAEVDPQHSPDVKVDVPDAQGQYQTPTNAITFYQFSDIVHDPHGVYPRSGADGTALTYRVYVQVHQRGVGPVAQVRAILLTAPVGTTTPDLPANYADNVAQGVAVTAPPWRTVGMATLQGVRVGLPRIAAFDLPTTLLPPAQGDSSHALVVLVHAVEDPFTNTETNVKQLSLSERRMALAVIRVQGT